MSYTTTSVTIIITLCTISTVNSNCHPAKYGNNPPQFTRLIRLRQGALKGVVYEPRENSKLPPVEIYRGIPYASPPTGGLRFMPPQSGAPLWSGEKCADTFGPVCPQKFPNVTNMAPTRREYFLNLKDYLQDQSEDCLYLNIYAPFQGPRVTRKYPVMVYIHGESFEWNSGNPYDGSVLAAYGNVIVVTFNFRLGILGFLKAGTEDSSESNFGLVDQIAALLWIKDNIAAFGGDPEAVTLLGHGTGAACASLLTISPMVLNNNRRLFHRAILMGGNALADWALAGNPSGVTYQVSQALNCPIQRGFADCLRRKNLSDIMAADPILAAYKTQFGPIVDSRVVPNDPRKSMTQYHNIFSRFELLYGVTEQESIQLIDPVALTYGMLEKERDKELRKYLRSRCEMMPEHCLKSTLNEYGGDFTLSERYGDYTGHEPDRASLARDALLDILSDARTVAPMVQMAKYHAALNLQSYFYVFTHKTHSKEYIRNKSFNGEELPYVFGIPLDGPKFHFTDSYTDMERLFSEIIMSYFCSFAYSGNPNVPRRSEFLTYGPQISTQFDIEWPEYDLKYEKYLELKIPPQPSAQYRNQKMSYWNDVFPTLSQNEVVPYEPPRTVTKKPTKIYILPTSKQSHPNPPPWLFHDIPQKSTSIGTYSRPANHQDAIGTVVRKTDKERPDTANQNVYGTVVEAPPQEVKQGQATNTIMFVGGLFLLANIILLLVIYIKCYRKKKPNSEKIEEIVEISEEEKLSKGEDVFLVNGCNIVRMMSSSHKSGDTYEAVKCGSGSKYKLSRQMSNSTIDAHTKVRDWIAQEIVNKYSPKYVRRPAQSGNKTKIPIKEDISISMPTECEKDSTLGRSPTRPVSPSDDQGFEPPVMKTSTITRPKMARPAKVSVAIDATPTGRGSSVLKQQPIELTKSLDYPLLHPITDIPLRRSVTLEDFSPRVVDSNKELRMSSTSINLKYPEDVPAVVKIRHGYSKSDPVQDMHLYKSKKLRTFDPNCDINVTSRDDTDLPTPLTPEESLLTIKRRRFPKVLPDHPGREALVHKRRSMPAHGLFLPIPESSSFSQPNSPNFVKLPPVPPPRTTTLPKQSSVPFLCLSEPVLAEEPYVPEPEVVCNNLYVGPLIPKDKGGSKGEELNIQPIYDKLKNATQSENKVEKAKTIVTTNVINPIKRADPKIVVRPTMTRKGSEEKSGKNIPRVVAPDNRPHVEQCVNFVTTVKSNGETSENGNLHKVASTDDSDELKEVKCKRSLIPTPVRVDVNKTPTSSSSESTPSEESDTGTVVKKI